MHSQTALTDLGMIKLPRDPSAPHQARRFVAIWAGQTHPACENLSLAVSELVTNAVTHADHGQHCNWLRVQLAQGSDFFRLAVTDPGSTYSMPYCIPPQAPYLNRMAEKGRGLAIVAILSRGRWGTHLLPPNAHRLVWCHLDIEPCELSEGGVHLLYPAAV